MRPSLREIDPPDVSNCNDLTKIALSSAYPEGAFTNGYTPEGPSQCLAFLHNKTPGIGAGRFQSEASIA
jgi:hypothetical protein